MKVLLTTDGSTYATTALTTATQLLTRTDNTFDVTCIIPDFSPPSRPTKRSPNTLKVLEQKYQQEMKRRTEQVLADAKRTLHAGGIKAHTFTVSGSPADVLVKLSEDYDVVVAGTQSGSGRLSPGLGPVASRIVEHVSGIVVIGRPLLNEKTFRVLIGVDGSASSENALEAFANTFAARDSEVTLMHVVEKPWLRLGLEEEWPSEFERSYAEPSDQPEAERLFGKELWSEAEQIVASMRERLSRRCLSIETRIMEGSPANELLRQAEVGEYDLAVVGATGLSDLKHTMLGSVSFKLASYAPCSVAVIR